MTAQQKRQVAVGVFTTIIGVGLLTAGSALRDNLVWRGEYDVFLSETASWRKEQRDITLDILCSEKVDPANRRCR